MGEWPVVELDSERCKVLADTLGDSPETVISAHLLRRLRCSAYAVGPLAHPDAAVIRPIRLAEKITYAYIVNCHEGDVWECRCGSGRCLGDTDREIRANFDRLERATRAVIEPGVSFSNAWLKPFRPLSGSQQGDRLTSQRLVRGFEPAPRLHGCITPGFVRLQ